MGRIVPRLGQQLVSVCSKASQSTRGSRPGLLRVTRRRMRVPSSRFVSPAMDGEARMQRLHLSSSLLAAHLSRTIAMEETRRVLNNVY
jgi:hypothetical protein